MIRKWNVRKFEENNRKELHERVLSFWEQPKVHFSSGFCGGKIKIARRKWEKLKQLDKLSFIL